MKKITIIAYNVEPGSKSGAGTKLRQDQLGSLI